LVLLKNALEANAKDPEVNLQCAKVLRARAQFDQAIACLHRVEQLRPDDEEIQRLIADLAVEKTIHQGGYEDADGGKKKIAAGQQGQQAQQRTLSEEERLEREIAKDSKAIPKYVELSELYLRDENYTKAEEVLARAFEVSNGDIDVRERWEDAQLRGLRYHVMMAKKKADESGSEEAKQEWKRLRKKQLAKELELYKHRCERYPNNLTYKYDLGLRYQVNGQYNEAIKEFQQAKNDPRRKGLCLLALGQCFQQIKRPELAMSHYEMSIQEIPDREASKKKEALHLAGKLSIALSNLDAAEKYLTTLAGLDFNYKDVSALLDKVAELRKRRPPTAEE
jgi:tetratricopeptide (TPR) repeat protein